MAVANWPQGGVATVQQTFELTDADSLIRGLARSAASAVLDAGMPNDPWGLPALCSTPDWGTSSPARSMATTRGQFPPCIAAPPAAESGEPQPPFTLLKAMFGFFDMPSTAKTGISESGSHKSLRDAVLGTAHYVRAVQPDTEWIAASLFGRTSTPDLAAVVPGIHTMSRLFREHFPAVTDMPAYLALAVHERIRGLAERDQVVRKAAVKRALDVYIKCVQGSTVQLAARFARGQNADRISQSGDPKAKSSAVSSPNLLTRRLSPVIVPSAASAHGFAGQTDSAHRLSPLASRGAAIVAGLADRGGEEDQTIAQSISAGSTVPVVEAIAMTSQSSSPADSSRGSCGASPHHGDVSALARAEVMDLLRGMSCVRLGDALAIALGGDPTLGEVRFRDACNSTGLEATSRKITDESTSATVPFTVMAFRIASGALALADERVEAEPTTTESSRNVASGQSSPRHHTDGLIAMAASVSDSPVSSVVLRTREPTGLPRLKHDSKAVTLMQCLRWWPVTKPEAFGPSPESRSAARAILGQAVIVAAMCGPSMAGVPRTISGPPAVLQITNETAATPRKLPARELSGTGAATRTSDALSEFLAVADRASKERSPAVDSSACEAGGATCSPLSDSLACVALAGCESRPLLDAASLCIDLSHVPSPHTPCVSAAAARRRPPCPAAWLRPCARGMPRPPALAHRRPAALRDSCDTISMADMQLLVDFLIQRHPDLEAVKSDPVLRHRYTCYVVAFCMGAMRGYTATAVTAADVNDSNFVTMLRSCSKSRLMGLLPFDPAAAIALSQQFDEMVAEMAATVSSGAVWRPHDCTAAHAGPGPGRGGSVRSPGGDKRPVRPSADPESGPAVCVERVHAAAVAGGLPGLFGTRAAASAAPLSPLPATAPGAEGDGPAPRGVAEALAVPLEMLQRVALGAPRRVASGVAGYLCFEDLVWLSLAAQDAMAGPSIEYWCRVLDADENGWIGALDIRQAVRSRVRQQLQLDEAAAGRLSAAAAVRGKASSPEEVALVERAEARALIQLVDVLRPASFVGAGSADGTVRFTASQVRHRMAGPVVFHSLVSLRDRVGMGEAGEAPGSTA